MIDAVHLKHTLCSIKSNRGDVVHKFLLLVKCYDGEYTAVVLQQERPSH